MRGDVPKFHFVIKAARGQRFAVRGERHGRDAGNMTLERRQLFTGRQFHSRASLARNVVVASSLPSGEKATEAT